MYLTVNDKELDALCGLSYIQQITYLRGIRPYMDRKTFLVGIKRRISYQSLSEVLYVEPHQGIKDSGSPSRQQIRRAIKGLERAGLISIQSIDKHLILNCLLADISYCVQNKPDTKPTQQPDINHDVIKPYETSDYSDLQQKNEHVKNLKADTPHNSKNNCVYMRERFEIFWELYPQKKNQSQAFDAFSKLNPSNELFQEIINALKSQITHREQMIQAGCWVPKWKYPTNWLTQQCWNDELEPIVIKEQHHATNQSTGYRKPASVLLNEQCKDAAFDFEDDTKTSAGKVIQFGRTV